MTFDSKKWTAPVNALIAAALSVFIYYISAHSVSVVRLLLYFPLTTLVVAHGLYWAGSAAMLAVAALAMLFGVEAGLSVGLRFCVISFVIGMAIRKRKALFHEIVFPAILFTALCVLLLFVEQWVSGRDIMALLREEMQSVSLQVMELAKEQGALPAGSEVTLRQFFAAMLNLLPALFFVEGLLTATTTSLFSRLLLSRTEEDVARFSFAQFQITRKISAVLLTLVALGMLLSLWLEPLAYLGSNIGIAVLVLYAFHGIARIDEQLSRRHVPKVLRALLYLSSFIFVFLTFFFVLIGFLLSFLYERNSAGEGGSHE